MISAHAVPTLLLILNRPRAVRSVTAHNKALEPKPTQKLNIVLNVKRTYEERVGKHSHQEWPPFLLGS